MSNYRVTLTHRQDAARSFEALYTSTSADSVKRRALSTFPGWMVVRIEVE